MIQIYQCLEMLLITFLFCNYVYSVGLITLAEWLKKSYKIIIVITLYIMFVLAVKEIGHLFRDHIYIHFK